MKAIMIQVSAKIGAQPWGLKGLPLMDVPTMIIGIDVAHWVGNKSESVVGFTASMDWYVSSYYIDSVSKANLDKRSPQDITFELEPLF